MTISVQAHRPSQPSPPISWVNVHLELTPLQARQFARVMMAVRWYDGDRGSLLFRDIWNALSDAGVLYDPHTAGPGSRSAHAILRVRGDKDLEVVR